MSCSRIATPAAQQTRSSCRELNPGLPRDRRKYKPRHYQGLANDASLTRRQHRMRATHCGVPDFRAGSSPPKTPARITVAKTRWPSGPGVGPLSRWGLPAMVRPEQVSHRYCTDPSCATRKELYVGHLPNVSRSERHRCKRGPAQRRALTGRSADKSKPVQSTDGSSKRATHERSSKGKLRCQRAHIRATRRARSKQEQAANPHPAM